MADVAAISVISSGVVGVLGAAAAIYGQRTTLHTEQSKRLEARRDDLRSVLAEAATVAMSYNAPAGTYDRDAQAMALGLDNVAGEMEIHRARMGIRVGPQSAVYLAYREIQLAVWAMEAAHLAAPDEVNAATLARDPAGLDEPTRAAVIAIHTAHGAAQQATAEFLAAAARLVGPPTP